MDLKAADGEGRAETRHLARVVVVGGTVPAPELLAAVGIDTIHRRTLGLANTFRARLSLPAGDSAIVTVASDGALERLRAVRTKAAVRAGAVRLSFHLHNTNADVDAVARALGG